MSLTVRGSAFYFGDAVEAEDAGFPLFFQWIKDTGNDAQWPFIMREGDVEIKRRVFCDKNETHFYGIFLSARNAEFQHYIRQEAGRVIVEAISTGGNPPVEMNFFAIRLDSMKGLYSHYIGSYRFQQFLGDLWASYGHFVEMKKAAALLGLEGRAAKTVREQYAVRSRCNYGPLYTPGAFSDLIDRLGSVSELRMTTYEVEDAADQPVSDHLKSVHRVYRFDAVRADAGFRAWCHEKRSQSLRMLASGRQVYSGSVVGADNEGRALTIDFENTLEDHLDCHYDDIGTFEVANIANHRIINDMINSMANSVLFRPAE